MLGCHTGQLSCHGTWAVALKAATNPGSWHSTDEVECPSHRFGHWKPGEAQPSYGKARPPFESVAGTGELGVRSVICCEINTGKKT